ncbi:MAG: hypothetical protein JWM12_405 [Ilumatobacteraceae bacterium]|nr:hypothetical protein [Ilumatobacteraceae bacterium]
MIFHVTEASRWQRSLREGTHTGSTRGAELLTVGFIHCSTAAQWRGVVERFYAGVPDLLLLHVDESLLTSSLVIEPAVGGGEAAGDGAGAGAGGETFPHVYGPIDLAAVVAVEPIA